jgi:hypothetical protein
MSKELIEQLALQSGGDYLEVGTELGELYENTRLTMPHFIFNENELEAFAKAYQAAQPVNVLINALKSIASLTQDTDLLWWQKEAREALAAYQAAAPIDRMNLAKELDAKYRQGYSDGWKERGEAAPIDNGMQLIEKLNKTIGDLQGDNYEPQDVLNAVLDIIEQALTQTRKPRKVNDGYYKNDN